MALKLSYVARETGINLWRNITLTVASMVTVAVSLALVGSALLLRQGVANLTARWEGGIEFIVFLQPHVTDDQRLAVERSLDQNPDVDTFVYVDQQGAYDEFKELFRNSPDLIEAVEPEVLPPSYRVVPRIPDAELVQALGEQFEGSPGVREVAFAFDTVRSIQDASRTASTIILIVAAVLLVAAGLLILNTIRMAMFARRREIEVMKLVGATNWFIRIPFMLEGMIQGAAGGAVAVVLVIGVSTVVGSLVGTDDLAIFQGLAVGGSELTSICLILLGIGVVVGAIGSAVAVTRFLDV
jgi:cell division transport system permease protein